MLPDGTSLEKLIRELFSLRLTNQRLEAEMADNGHNLFNLLSRVDELENLLDEARARLKQLISVTSNLRKASYDRTQA